MNKYGLLASIGSAALAVAVVTANVMGRQGNPASEPPSDLVKVGAGIATSAKAVNRDLKRSWYDWNTLAKQVMVTRRERALVTDVFEEQRQELSTSYYVVDVRWRCDGTDEIRELFVAGVLDDGNSVIERWKFTYSLAFGPNGQPVPLSLRRPPRVNRTQLYSGSSLGRVLTVEPDPDGRFVLFLTRNPAALYRINLPGGAPVLVMDQSTVPAIANAGIVGVRQHITEGRQYHLSSGHRWEYDASLPSEVIFLRDGNNDTVFDTPVVVTQAQWAQAGYDIGSAWVRLCQ